MAVIVDNRRTRGRRRSVMTATTRTGWLFVLPFVVVFLIGIVAPVVYALFLSLFRTTFVGGEQFVGFENYTYVFTDPSFWGGIGRVTGFMLLQIPLMLGIGLVAALAIDSGRLHLPGMWRILLFLPYAVPGVVAVLIWGFVYGPRYGLVGTMNDALGMDLLSPLSPQWVLAAIANIVTWSFAGYNMLIFYSALRTIPEELYEAASLDGAGAIRTIFAVKIPALRGALVITTMFSVIGSFQLFNEPNLLRPLAPNVITSDFTPTLYAYNLSFAGQQYNLSATVAIVLGIITAVIAYTVQLRGMRAEQR